MNISLRNAQPSDLDTIRQWRNRPEIRMHMFTQHEIDAEEHAAWYSRWAGDATRRVLIAEISYLPVGLVTLINVAPLSDAEWGFYVRPASPKGTGTRVCKAALDYAFDTLGVGTVIGRVLVGNTASERLHRRLGFSLQEMNMTAPATCVDDHRASTFLLRREQWFAARAH